MKVILLRASFLACLALGWFHGEAFAEFEQPAECQVYGEIKPNENPTFQHINCLLTHAALEEGIPPEIVKGIATQESGEQIGTIAKFDLWSQFSNEGEPKIAPDGGVGIMQITNQSNYDSERLKYDIYYNIQTGVKILSGMYDIPTLPKIKNSRRDVIENWYFPVMAYNGIKPKNSPLCKSEHLPECPSIGTENIYAYQEKVFSNIEEYSLANDQDLTLAKFPFSVEDFNYDPGQTENIEFLKKEYTLTDSVHSSSYFLKKGDKAVVTGNDVKLRQQPGASTIITELPKNTILNIDDNFKYDQDSTLKRQYVWYPVSVEKQGVKGYISSAYLMKNVTEERVIKVSANTDKSGPQSIGTP
ncbi:SH3 domain-containing protein, partial [Priestia megaterium]|uniref:SH3 domain-containing protein n=1 Tax=Priestia megaterium TaxID=1404 RepID=UPI0021ACF7E9